MDILVKVLLLGKATVRKRNTGLMLHKLVCVRCCKKKITHKYSGMDDVMLFYSDFCCLQ